VSRLACRTADSMSLCTAALNLCFACSIWFGWMAKTFDSFPLLERKEHLPELLLKSHCPNIINAQIYRGSGTALFSQICEGDLEGTVCKRKKQCVL
jgi:hypothetical protein